MALDLGAVVGRVVLEDVEFQRTYVRVTRQMADLGTSAGKSAAGTARLDESLNAVGASGNRAAAGLGRAAKSASDSAAADQRAAAAAARHATALSDVSAVTTRYAAASSREQQAALRNAAAQNRLTAASAESGTATQLQARETARLAAAQASAVGAAKRLGTTSAVAGGRMRTAFAGSLKMAGELGLVFGAFELVKKSIDIGKEASAFQQSMLLIRTSAGASQGEVNAMSKAILAMAGPLATSPDELAAALYHVEQNGYRGKAALDALKVGAEGAKIGMASVEDTTNTMTIAMASGIHGVQNLQQAMGFMIATVGTGDMRLKDLNEALSGGILAIAKGFGASLRDVAAVLATLGDNGIRGADAATALRQTMMGFAAPAKGGADALRQVHLSMVDLRDDMEKHGLVYAMNDLNNHMKAAGITGAKVGGFITEAFGRKAGAGIAVVMGEIGKLDGKFEEAQKGAASFGDRWKATTKTTAFQFAQLRSEATAAGIGIATKLMPAAAAVAGILMGALHTGLNIASSALHPFALGFHALGDVLGPVGSALAAVGHFLAPLAPVLQGVGAAALAMFLAFKGGQLAVAGFYSIADGAAVLSGGVKNAAGDVGVSLGLMQRDAGATSAIMKAEFDKIAADALTASGAVDRLGVSFAGAAVEAETSAAGISTSAETASAAVIESGDAARIGWAGIAGPLALVAVGITAVIGLFHHSATASKEAADSAKAFTDAFKSSGANQDTILSAVVDQLTKNDVPNQINTLNKALGSTQFSGKQFVNAIAAGSPALEKLRAHLEAAVVAQHALVPVAAPNVRAQLTTPGQVAAEKLLKSLDAIHVGLTKAQHDEVAAYKQLGMAATPIVKVADNLGIASDQVKTYAGMLGLAVTKNGDLVNSTKATQAAILGIAKAYDTANQSGSDFLAAWQTFSSSAGASTDRAALIGSILKANAGDALGFATAINGAASAVSTLGADIAQNAASAVKGGESTRAYLKSLVDVTNGSIRYHKTAAGPLINDLQNVQTSAINAAQAYYLHNRGLIGAKAASDRAVAGYKGVEDSLVRQLHDAGLTTEQAQKLTDKYLGVPSHVKTLIEQAGADPIVTVLNEIGHQLSFLTGHPWRPTISLNDQASNRLAKIKALMDGLPRWKYISVVENTPTSGQLGHNQSAMGPNSAGGSAAWAPGGKLPPGYSTVGERGWELVKTDRSGRSEVFSHGRSMAATGLPDVLPGFASGTGGLSGNAKKIAEELRRMFGFSGNQIAAWLGNFKVESNFNPRAYNPRENAHGIAQWEGSRWVALQRFARAHHESATGLNTQLAFLGKEISRSLVNKIRGMSSPANVAALIDKDYERSSGSTRAARESYARQFARLRMPDAKLSGTASPLHTASSDAGKLAASISRLFTVGLGGVGRGGVASVPSIMAGLTGLERALVKAGLPKSFLADMKADNAAVKRLAGERNVAAGHLMTAQKHLAAAIATKTADTRAFRGAVAGTFDPTSAGTDSNGRVTGGRILATEKQAVTRARAWLTGIKRLVSLKVFPSDFIRALAGKGPDALAEVQAYASMSMPELKELRHDYLELGSLGQQAGVYAARRLDQPAVNKYAGQVRADQRSEMIAQRALVIEMRDIAHRIDKAMANQHIEGTLTLEPRGPGKIAAIIDTDRARGKHGRGHK